jgi:hypothetical protein
MQLYRMEYTCHPCLALNCSSGIESFLSLMITFSISTIKVRMIGRSQRSKAQKKVGRVFDVVWMTLKHTTILEEVEDDNSEEEFYIRLSNPSNQTTWYTNHLGRKGCIHQLGPRASLIFTIVFVTK